jgi:hypothetical protein
MELKKNLTPSLQENYHNYNNINENKIKKCGLPGIKLVLISAHPTGFSLPRSPTFHGIL